MNYGWGKQSRNHDVAGYVARMGDVKNPKRSSVGK